MPCMQARRDQERLRWTACECSTRLFWRGRRSRQENRTECGCRVPMPSSGEQLMQHLPALRQPHEIHRVEWRHSVPRFVDAPAPCRTRCLDSAEQLRGSPVALKPPCLAFGQLDFGEFLVRLEKCITHCFRRTFDSVEHPSAVTGCAEL